jgi:hypothetical protein
VREPRDRLRLAGDPRSAVIAIDHLDRDRPLQALVPGAIDRAEAAASDPGLDPEPAQDSLTDHGHYKFASGRPFPVGRLRD